MECIVHYPGHQNYSKLKSLSEINKKKILEAKQLRESLKGSNHHEEQCGAIPAVFSSSDQLHLEPCYKKFTLILSQKKELSAESRSSKRLSASSLSWLYPKECGICKKYKIKVRGKMEVPRQIAQDNASETLKSASKVINPALFYEIKDGI